MSYPLDVAAQNAALDALLSRDLSGVPTAWEVAIYNAHPGLGGTELTGTGGYARGSLNADLTDWPAAVAGLKESIAAALPDATADWSDLGPYWVLIDAADSTTRWFFGLLDDPLDVLDGATGNWVQPALSWNTEGGA